MDNLRNNYASLIVEGMDMTTLVQVAMEMIEENLSSYSDAELENEIVELYSEEVLEDLKGKTND